MREREEAFDGEEEPSDGEIDFCVRLDSDCTQLLIVRSLCL